MRKWIKKGYQWHGDLVEQRKWKGRGPRRRGELLKGIQIHRLCSCGRSHLIVLASSPSMPTKSKPKNHTPKQEKLTTQRVREQECVFWKYNCDEIWKRFKRLSLKSKEKDVRDKENAEGEREWSAIRSLIVQKFTKLAMYEREREWYSRIALISLP